MEKNNLSKSNKIKIIVLTALVLLAAIGGITYAYFGIQITGNDTASSMRLTTATMSLIYNDVQILSDQSVMPGWTSNSKTLTVYNDGDQTVYYNLIWRDLLNEVLYGELTLSATCSSDKSGNTCPSIDKAIPTRTSLTNNVTVWNSIKIEPKETHTYIVTISFIETGLNQNYNQGKQFYGTLNISEGSTPATISLKVDNGTLNTIDKGDEITISSTKIVEGQKETISDQDFYVVSSDASNTVLLAKYNLLVGDILENVENFDAKRLVKRLSPSDEGYGLQSSTAKGCATNAVNGVSQYVGVAPFSGTNYWDSSICQYKDRNWSCTGISNLKSEYATNGAGYSGSPYPNLYNGSMSNVAPSYSFSNDSGDLAQNNGYTIAYYVEEYINTLGLNVTGRLLTYEEEQTLVSSNRSIIFNGTSYWLVSASSSSNVWGVNGNTNRLQANRAPICSYFGVRPVIVVPTSDIQSS